MDARAEQDLAGITPHYLICSFSRSTISLQQESKKKKSLMFLRDGYSGECLKNWSSRWVGFIPQKVPDTVNNSTHLLVSWEDPHLNALKTQKVFSRNMYSGGKKGNLHQLI